MRRIALDCLKCGHHATMAEEDLQEHGLEPGTSLATLTKRTVCTRCGSRAVVARRIEGDEVGPGLVPDGRPAKS